MTLSGVMVGTIVLIVAFAILASRPSKPAIINIANSPSLGSGSAKVTVVEFSDFQCPSCQTFASAMLPVLEKEYQNTVRFVFKYFPLYEIHNLAKLSAQSAFCAGKAPNAKAGSEILNDKFWKYHDLLMNNPSAWEKTPEKFTEYAVQMGLNKDEFLKCQNSDEAVNAVMVDRSEGDRIGVNSTPSFFVNGEKMVGLLTLEQWRKKLEEKLNSIK